MVDIHRLITIQSFLTHGILTVDFPTHLPLALLVIEGIKPIGYHSREVLSSFNGKLKRCRTIPNIFDKFSFGHRVSGEGIRMLRKRIYYHCMPHRIGLRHWSGWSFLSLTNMIHSDTYGQCTSPYARFQYGISVTGSSMVRRQTNSQQ